MQKPVFSDDEDRRRLLTEEELRDARLHAAATIVVANALGCEFEDCRLDDEGRRWPVSLSVVEIKYPNNWQGAEAFASAAMIHEAGAMAVAKRHGRSPHRINTEDGAGLIQNSLVWNTSAASGARGPLHSPHSWPRCARGRRWRRISWICRRTSARPRRPDPDRCMARRRRARAVARRWRWRS
jgi:hypothetical protein